MNLDEIKQILDLVREHDLAEFELEREGMKIRVKKDAGPPHVSVAAPAHGGNNHHPSGLPPPPAAVVDTVPNGPADEAPPAEEVELAVVKSPIVGTFYRSAEPGARPFVEIGELVRKGQVLCIIEAMKLMNEIESEYEGEIVAAYAENGQPVQYGERLFAIRSR
jgi:acetyl-CoA carboxylase biotin carboxyl carrier protein